MKPDPTAHIRALNDQLRQRRLGGLLTMTAGVNALDFTFKAKALAALAEFDSFDADNDPHGEHDFGALSVDGYELLWKIDYYDATLTYGSEDPADESACTRVLTIMLAEEY